MMSTLLEQLKKRRIELGLKQNDMMLRVGVSRQQYQRLESKGNPRLNTLELIAKGLKGLKTHIDNEFLIFSYLGQDLPGALVAAPMEPEDVPNNGLSTHGKAKAVKFKTSDRKNKFSLAGIQMKFSMQGKGRSLSSEKR